MSRRILVVEDNRTTTYLMSVLLYAKGFWVRVCGNYDEALELIKADVLPDIALFDYYLDKRNGLDLVEQLRKATDKRIPCLLCTAAEEGKLAEIKERMERLDVKLLSKPFEPADLYAMLDKLCPNPLARKTPVSLQGA